MKYRSPLWATAAAVAMTLTACGGGGSSSGGKSGSETAPEITVFTASSQTTTTGQDVEFAWTIADTNEGDSLSCELDTDADGTAEYTFSDCENAQSQAHSYNTPGSYSAVLRVTNAAEESATSSIDIEVSGAVVVENSPPVVSSFDASTTAATTGQSVEISWNLTDPDEGNILSCELDIDGDATPEYFIANCEEQQSQSHIFDVADTYTVILRARDGAGGSVADTLEVVVTGSAVTAPTITSFTATPDSVVQGTATELAWAITDPEGDGVSCTVDIDNNGTAEYDIADCLSETTTTHTYDAAGDYTALLIATNAAGESRERTIVVSVTADGGDIEPGNTADPVISSYLVSSSSVMIEQETTFTWSQTDADSDATTCSIDFNGDGNADVQQADCAADSEVSHVYDIPGSYDAILTVDDGRGRMASETRTITVLPISFKLAADGPVLPGESLRYTFTFSNVSLTPVDNVRVLFRTPTGLSYNGRDDASPDANCFSCPEETEASWTFSSLAAGESATIEINADVSENIAPDATILASVNVTADNISGSVNLGLDTPVTAKKSAQLKLSASADALVAGDTLVMMADVGNVSSDSVEDLNLQMTLPAGSSVTAISDGGTEGDNGVITWAIGSLSVLETVRRHVTFSLSSAAIPGQIKMTSAAITGSGDDTVDSTAMLPVSISEDRSQLQLEVTSSADPAAAGEKVRYQISVGNRALVPATNVQVLMRTPKGLAYNGRDDASFDASCFTCSEGTEAFWSLGDIPAGESRLIELNANISSDLQAGSLVQASVLAYADTLGDTINVFDVLAIDNSASSTVVLSTPVDGYVAGDTVDLTASIGNASTTALEGMSMNLSLPVGASFVSATESGEYDATLNEVNWTVGSLPVLATTQRSVSFVLSGDALAGDIAPVSARIKHDGGTEIDASTSYRLNVVEVASPLAVTVSIAEGSATPGQRLRYTVTLKNNAFVPLNDVGIIYRVPSGLLFNGRDDVEPDASCFTCGIGVEASWSYTSIPAGETRIIDINANVSTDIQAGNLLVSQFVIRAENLGNDALVNTVTSVTQ